MLSGLQKTTLARPTKPTRLYLSSWNARPSDTNCAFTDTLARTVDGIKQVHLVSASIPHLFPTVGQAESIVYFSYKGADRTLTLDTTRRFATTAELAVHVQALLAAIPACSDITASVVTTDGFERLQFSHPTQTPTSNDVRFQAESVKPVQNASWKLGVAAPVYTAAAGTSTARGDGVIRLLRTSVVYVLSGMSNDSVDSFQTESVLGIVPVDVPWGSVVQWRAYIDSDWLDANIETARDVWVQLLDENREVLTLPNNAYVNLGIDTRNFYA